MRDPVVASNVNSYEREAIEGVLWRGKAVEGGRELGRWWQGAWGGAGGEGL